MANYKDILVVTTSSVEGFKVKKYLKPVTAHIVAGTNVFSDFFASFSDVFGGRSETYQKQLTSLYNEAIERVKYSAYELGANCIIGLKIDMDEISGKGKSMFMLTAVGTAVVLDKEFASFENKTISNEKLENVGIDKIEILKTKKDIIKKANSNNLRLTEDIWNFITANQVSEIYPFLLKKFNVTIANGQMNPGSTEKFYQLFVRYLDNFPEDKKIELLYDSLMSEKNELLILKISDIIKELNLFDFNRILELLENNDFQKQKLAVKISTYNRSFYNKKDVEDLKILVEKINLIFKEKGIKTTKKQIFSSKEKEVWSCECGKINELENIYCSNCKQDIYGFKYDEMKPSFAVNLINEKINLISEFIM